MASQRQFMVGKSVSAKIGCVGKKVKKGERHLLCEVPGERLKIDRALPTGSADQLFQEHGSHNPHIRQGIQKNPPLTPSLAKPPGLTTWDSDLALMVEAESASLGLGGHGRFAVFARGVHFCWKSFL